MATSRSSFSRSCPRGPSAEPPTPSAMQSSQGYLARSKRHTNWAEKTSLKLAHLTFTNGSRRWSHRRGTSTWPSAAARWTCASSLVHRAQQCTVHDRVLLCTAALLHYSALLRDAPTEDRESRERARPNLPEYSLVATCAGGTVRQASRYGSVALAAHWCSVSCTTRRVWHVYAFRRLKFVRFVW